MPRILQFFALSFVFKWKTQAHDSIYGEFIWNFHLGQISKPVLMTGSFKREIETNFRFLRALDRFVSEESAVTGGEWAAIRTPEIVYGSHDRVGNGVIVWINETAAHGFKPTNHCR